MKMMIRDLEYLKYDTICYLFPGGRHHEDECRKSTREG